MQEAFYHTNRVCTLSLHQYDPESGFFPGTGGLEEIGEKDGRHCSINVPLKKGCSDQKFFYLFKCIFDRTNDVFKPDAIWMQCGADSLRGDTIGAFNLSIKGHGKAIKYVLGKNIPTVFNGGGGYNVENVARCWAYESLIIANKIPESFVIPSNSKYRHEYSNDDLLFSPENKHGITNDFNTEDYSQKLMQKVFGVIDKIDNSVPFLKEIPRKGSSQWIDERFEEKEDGSKMKKDVIDKSEIKSRKMSSNQKKK